jgi:hypothetical protein
LLKKSTLIAILLTSLLPTCSFANQWQVAAASDSDGNPEKIRGAIASYEYVPKGWRITRASTWLPEYRFSISGHVAHWDSRARATLSGAKNHLTTLAITPNFVTILHQGKSLRPYALVSVGPAYLSTVKFATQHLGSHFNFQDTLGLGVEINKHWDLSLNYLHYSNAGLASHNQGVDIHYLLRLGYRT